jgi:hypothetical protein
MVSPSKMAAFVLAALAQTLKNIKQFRFCLHRTRSDEQKEYRSERTENGDGVMGGGGEGGRKAKGTNRRQGVKVRTNGAGGETLYQQPFSASVIDDCLTGLGSPKECTC